MQLPIVEYVVVDSKYNRGQNLNVKIGYKINTTRNNTTRNDVKKDDDAKSLLQELRITCKENVLIAYLNINSIRNKLTALKEVISDCIDTLIIAETKLDESFHTSQLDITGHIPPLRVDRNQHGGGILIYIIEGIPAREISLLGSTSKDIEAKALEFNLNRIKWLLFGIYRPPFHTDNFFLNEISKNIEHFRTKYENFLVIGDFNLTEKSMVLQDFMQRLNFKNVIKEPTCFKSNCPTCIDLILTSDTGKVSNTRTIEIGLSDFHVMVTTSLKGSFQKKKPKIITYRDYKKFGNQIFNLKVREAIDSVTNIQTDFSLFNSTVKYILNKQAPLKQKYIRANDAPFMSKNLRKAIMKRSRPLKTGLLKPAQTKTALPVRHKETCALRFHVKTRSLTIQKLIQKPYVTINDSGKLSSPCFQIKFELVRASRY